MKKIWRKFKMLFGWKPKEIPVPVNNFKSWTEEEQKIAVLINMVRQEEKPMSIVRKIGGLVLPSINKVPDLIPNKLCRNEARKRCEVQYNRKIISHDGVGEAFRALTSKGYTNPAEILAYLYSTPETVVSAWYKSLSHRKIILSNNYKYFGVAQTENKGKKYYCIIFCK